MRRKSNRREFMRSAGWFASTGLVVGANPLTGAVGEPLVQTRRVSMGAKLRELLQGPEPIQTILPYDAPTAKLAEINGFKCLFYGGSVSAEQYCLPNIGLLSLPELIDIYEKITEVVNIPMIADADDLGGNPSSVYRNAKALERAGLAGVYFEDLSQETRIRTRSDNNPYADYLDSSFLIPTDQMVANIRAAVDARSDMLICVNCYSQQNIDSPQKWEEAMERGVAYAEAGADVLCFTPLRTVAESRRAADRVKRPLLTGAMGPDEIPTSRMKEAGVMIGVYTRPRPRDISLGAVQRAYAELKDTGVWTDPTRGVLPDGYRAMLNRELEYDRIGR